jgi:hypothetical protein
MLSLNARTKIKPEEVIKKAVQFFGPGGYGLKIIQQDAGSVSFEGGGGGVRVTACTDEKGTSVDLETREWEFQLREFVDKIK